MYKIKANVGIGRDPVELQQAVDNDLQTRDKTVVGAINELLDKIEDLEPVDTAKPVVNANTRDDFPSVGSVDVIYKAQSEKLLYQWNPDTSDYDVLGEAGGIVIGDGTIISGGGATVDKDASILFGGNASV